MGKFASFTRNTILGSIVILLAHLSYRLYELAIRLSIACDKITETNMLIRNLYDIVIQLAKRLGVKVSNGEFVNKGAILIRQNGTKWHPGKNVKLGNDFTIFALINGFVSFKKTHKTFISVTPKS